MAYYPLKKMGWSRPLSGWESVNNWRKARARMRADFAQSTSIAMGALAGAANGTIEGSGALAIQAAIKRVQAETKAKQEEMLRNAARATTPVTPRIDLKESAFSSGGQATLDSGTKVDLNSDTITLSNGTVLDIKTGVKVNVAV